MILHVYVHQIDTVAHPDQAAGWRWAVHYDRTPGDMGTVLNAGWQPTRQDASMIGEAAAVVGVRAAQLAGDGTATFHTWDLREDPQPGAGLDSITVMG